MKPTLLLLVSLNLLAACNQAAPGTTAPPVAAHTSVAAAAVPAGAAGIYQGLLPCADCAGIETKLYLFPDSTYEETLTYLGEVAPVSTVLSGRWAQPAADQVRLVQPTNSGSALYRLTSKGLQQLDMSGQPVTGALAGRYFLSRTGAL